RRDAARLLRQRPILLLAALRMPAANALAGDVDPVQPLLARMPERRLTPRIGRRHGRLPSHGAGSTAPGLCAIRASPRSRPARRPPFEGAGSTAMVICAIRVSPGSSTVSPSSAADAPLAYRCTALLTWLTGSIATYDRPASVQATSRVRPDSTRTRMLASR